MTTKQETMIPAKIASISIKTLGYTAKEIRKLVEDTNEVQLLARIGGVVLESFSGESKNGQWTGFKGIFTVVNRDNKAFSATVAYLPTSLTKKIIEQLNQGIAEVEFIADISVSASDKVASGYAYLCEPLMSEIGAKKAETIAQRVLAGRMPISNQLENKGAKKAS